MTSIRNIAGRVLLAAALAWSPMPAKAGSSSRRLTRSITASTVSTVFASELLRTVKPMPYWPFKWRPKFDGGLPNSMSAICSSRSPRSSTGKLRMASSESAPLTK